MLFFIVLFQKHFVDVSKSEEFLNLTKGEVLDILVRDELYVSTEEQVSHVIITISKKKNPLSTLGQQGV